MALLRSTIIHHLKNLPWIKVVLWTLGIGLLSVMTVWDFLPLLEDYKNDNIATQIKIIKDESVAKPNISICLTYPSGALEEMTQYLIDPRNRKSDNCPWCETMKDHSWDVWNNLSLVNGSAVATGILNKLFQLDDEELEKVLSFNRSNYNWNEPILDAVWEYISCTTFEGILSTVKLSNKMNNTKDPCSAVDLGSLPWLPREKVDKLVLRVVQYVSIYLKICVIDDQKVIQERPLENRLRDIVIKGSYFCLAMYSDSSQETFTFTPIENDTSPPWNRSEQKNLFSIFPGKTVLFSFMENHERLYPADQRVTATKFDEDVTVAYEIEARVIETRPTISCDKSTASYYVCVAKRQVEKSIQNCHCVPFVHRFIVNVTEYDYHPYCNISHYNHFQNTLCLTTEPTPDEEKQCKDKCQYLFYQWKTTSIAGNRDSLEWQFRVKRAQIVTPFIEFRISLRDTPEKFISQVGGVVGLYLGFSWVSVCALVIWCIDRMMEYYRERRRSMEFNQGRELDLVWSQRQMISLETIIRRLMKEEMETIIRRVVKEEMKKF